MNESEAAEELQRLTRELENFQDIAQQLVPLPGEVPTLEGFDIWGGSLPGERLGWRRPHHVRRLQEALRSDSAHRSARAEGRLDVVENLERCQHKGWRRADRRRRPSHDGRTAGGDAPPGVSARRDLRVGSLRPDHPATVREPQHAVLSVLGHEQVRVADLRRDLRRREVPLPVGRATVPVGVLEPARPVHGGQPAISACRSRRSACCRRST